MGKKYFRWHDGVFYWNEERRNNRWVWLQKEAKSVFGNNLIWHKAEIHSASWDWGGPIRYIRTFEMWDCTMVWRQLCKRGKEHSAAAFMWKIRMIWRNSTACCDWRRFRHRCFTVSCHRRPQPSAVTLTHYCWVTVCRVVANSHRRVVFSILVFCQQTGATDWALWGQQGPWRLRWWAMTAISERVRGLDEVQGHITDRLVVSRSIVWQSDENLTRQRNTDRTAMEMMLSGS